jgi:hypothetical protein
MHWRCESTERTAAIVMLYVAGTSASRLHCTVAVLVIYEAPLLSPPLPSRERRLTEWQSIADNLPCKFNAVSVHTRMHSYTCGKVQRYIAGMLFVISVGTNAYIIDACAAHVYCRYYGSMYEAAAMLLRSVMTYTLSCSKPHSWLWHQCAVAV